MGWGEPQHTERHARAQGTHLFTHTNSRRRALKSSAKILPAYENVMISAYL